MVPASRAAAAPLDDAQLAFLVVELLDLGEGRLAAAALEPEALLDLDEVTFALLFAAEPDLEGDFFTADFEPLALEDVGFRLFADRDLLRATRAGRFQPTALSARNVVGMETTLSGLSTTAAAAASARSARTSEMTFAGRRARAAWTRFVSSSTNI